MSSRTSGIEIVSPPKSLIPTLAATIAKAFHGLPASQFLVPDPTTRERIFRRTFRFDVEDVMKLGTPYATVGCEGVALWMPVGKDGPSAPGLDERIVQIDKKLAHRYAEFYEILHHRHPAGREHHHLMILAVHPDRWRQGLGSHLLRAHHDYLDSIGMPGYLEAANISAAALYRRHGYTDCGFPLELPNGALMYPMWREPRGEVRTGPVPV